MVPVVAIVGRSNVGKSTLFNALTEKRNALVFDLPGTTRDRQYGSGKIGDCPYILIDTGGIGGNGEIIDDAVTQQSWQAINEADVILLMVDGKAGVTTLDMDFARQLRKINKPKHLLVNKTDGLDLNLATADFHKLGCGAPIPISAGTKRGLSQLTAKFLADFITAATSATSESDAEVLDTVAEAGAVDILETNNVGIKVAIVGQPNVGKSTLVNRILGEERVVVSELAGTTRDCIFVPFVRDEQAYTLIDTAGVRRKARVDNTIEKFSVVKTLKAIEEANVVVFMIDATRGVTDQDLHLLDFIVSAGRSLVVLVNKWDGLPGQDKDAIKKAMSYRLQFVDFAIVHFISALHGSGVGNIFTSINRAYRSATRDLPTNKLTKILEEVVTEHQPPLVHGRRIKLRYAHSGGHNPPRIIIHGNQTEQVPASYKRYMVKAFIKKLNLQGTPVFIEFKTGENPYAGKRNTLTPRQQRKQERVRK